MHLQDSKLQTLGYAILHSKIVLTVLLDNSGKKITRKGLQMPSFNFHNIDHNPCGHQKKNNKTYIVICQP